MELGEGSVVHFFFPCLLEVISEVSWPQAHAHWRVTNVYFICFGDHIRHDPDVRLCVVGWFVDDFTDPGTLIMFLKHRCTWNFRDCIQSYTETFDEVWHRLFENFLKVMLVVVIMDHSEAGHWRYRYRTFEVVSFVQTFLFIVSTLSTKAQTDSVQIPDRKASRHKESCSHLAVAFDSYNLLFVDKHFMNYSFWEQTSLDELFVCFDWQKLIQRIQNRRDFAEGLEDRSTELHVWIDDGFEWDVNIFMRTSVICVIKMF